MIVEMIMGEDRSLTMDTDKFLNKARITVREVRILAKLATASDLIYGTNAVEVWKSAIGERVELCVYGMKQQDALRHTALERGDHKAHKAAIDKLKKVDSKRRKYMKFITIFEEGK
ncbi:hypothetical protein [uncultured Ruminococcus sp.]|uniref:hypothetical protein n=1 Tax=uncultured Ruminococcus sp. TaxID=165186 RepID=UPI00260A8110|nr:hypothetical protein [uncultured Ruminococcus sp.]